MHAQLFLKPKETVDKMVTIAPQHPLLDVVPQDAAKLQMVPSHQVHGVMLKKLPSMHAQVLLKSKETVDKMVTLAPQQTLLDVVPQDAAKQSLMELLPTHQVHGVMLKKLPSIPAEQSS